MNMVEFSRRRTARPSGPAELMQHALQLTAGNTNENYLKWPYGKLWPNSTTVAVYKCPADQSTAVILNYTYERVRSYALNRNANRPDDWEWAPNAEFVTFTRVSRISNPAQIFTFIDQREDSIDDWSFGVDMKDTGAAAELVDIPANRHNNACGICFADGHAEIHKWRDVRTTFPVGRAHLMDNISSPNNIDVLWLQQHCTVPAN
jgi:prepilin-type processing-associated H-X9-DG protein